MGNGCCRRYRPHRLCVNPVKVTYLLVRTADQRFLPISIKSWVRPKPMKVSDEVNGPVTYFCGKSSQR